MYIQFHSYSVIDNSNIIAACGDTAVIKLDGRCNWSVSDLQDVAKERQNRYPQYKYVAFSTAKSIKDLPEEYHHMIK